MAFELPQLPYAYDALEPYIDAHYNSSFEASITPILPTLMQQRNTDMEGKTIENILINLDMKNTAS
jgi:Fe-Mn family superoxide dismutase